MVTGHSLAKRDNAGGQAILSFLIEHPHACFNREALLVIGRTDGACRAEQALGCLLERGLIERRAESGLFRLAG
jgi:hypothetical protein